MLVTLAVGVVLFFAISWVIDTELRVSEKKAKQRQLLARAMGCVRRDRLGEVSSLVSPYGFFPEVKDEPDYWDSWLPFVKCYTSSNCRLKISINFEQEVELRLFDLKTDRSTESHQLGGMYLLDQEKKEVLVIRTLFTAELEEMLENFDFTKEVA